MEKLSWVLVVLVINEASAFIALMQFSYTVLIYFFTYAFLVETGNLQAESDFFFLLNSNAFNFRMRRITLTGIKDLT